MNVACYHMELMSSYIMQKCLGWLTYQRPNFSCDYIHILETIVKYAQLSTHFERYFEDLSPLIFPQFM